MQAGLLGGAPKHDLAGVVSRIDGLANQVRRHAGVVCVIQQAGGSGDQFEPSKPGWGLLLAPNRESTDLVISKTPNDPFFETDLATTLSRLRVGRVLVTGWATDLCVDATVRSAAARGYKVIAIADGDTVSDRPHLPAAQVLAHHHWVWTNLLAPHAVRLARAADVYPM